MDVDSPVHRTPENRGCRVQTDLTVGRVGGNFHVATKPTLGNNGVGSSMLITGGHLVSNLHAANLSHTIHHLSFGPPFPGQSDPLHHIVNIVPTDIGQYQFHMQVIPTEYRALHKRRSVSSNQYTVTEQFVKLDILSALRSTSGPGVYFYYDFYPVKVQYAETKSTFLQFMTRVCGIVGGVFTVSGLIDGVLYHSYEAIKKAA